MGILYMREWLNNINRDKTLTIYQTEPTARSLHKLPLEFFQIEHAGKKEILE